MSKMILIDEATLTNALEALETAWTYDEDNADEYYFKAITALRKALAALPAQQQPVAMLSPALSDDEIDKLAEAVNSIETGDKGWHHLIDVALSIAAQPAQRKPLAA